MLDSVTLVLGAGHDLLGRLRKVLRGELSSNGGYSATGGGIAQEITLPNTSSDSIPGQGFKQHRSWEVKEPEISWRDRW